MFGLRDFRKMVSCLMLMMGMMTLCLQTASAQEQAYVTEVSHPSIIRE